MGNQPPACRLSTCCCLAHSPAGVAQPTSMHCTASQNGAMLEQVGPWLCRLPELPQVGWGLVKTRAGAVPTRVQVPSSGAPHHCPTEQAHLVLTSSFTMELRGCRESLPVGYQSVSPEMHLLPGNLGQRLKLARGVWSGETQQICPWGRAILFDLPSWEML